MLRFILVNNRTPRGVAHCALCCAKITGSYIRDINTKFYYCNRACADGFPATVRFAIEHHLRAVS